MISFWTRDHVSQFQIDNIKLELLALCKEHFYTTSTKSNSLTSRILNSTYIENSSTVQRLNLYLLNLGIFNTGSQQYQDDGRNL